METVSLKYCKYDKKSKVLGVSSEVFGGSFPREFFVRSHVTGMDVRFVAIGVEDVLYDEDGWDGEMMVYRPVGNVPTIDHMVVYHEF